MTTSAGCKTQGTAVLSSNEKVFLEAAHNAATKMESRDKREQSMKQTSRQEKCYNGFLIIRQMVYYLV